MLCSVYSLLLILNSNKYLLLRLHLKRVYCTKTCGRKLLSNCLPSIFSIFGFLSNVLHFTTRSWGRSQMMKDQRSAMASWCPIVLSLLKICWTTLYGVSLVQLEKTIVAFWVHRSWRRHCKRKAEAVEPTKPEVKHLVLLAPCRWSDGDVEGVFWGSSLEYLVLRVLRKQSRIQMLRITLKVFFLCNCKCLFSPVPVVQGLNSALYWDALGLIRGSMVHAV